jgi:hypothetical protein
LVTKRMNSNWVYLDSITNKSCPENPAIGFLYCNVRISINRFQAGGSSKSIQ